MYRKQTQQNNGTTKKNTPCYLKFSPLMLFSYSSLLILLTVQNRKIILSLIISQKSSTGSTQKKCRIKFSKHNTNTVIGMLHHKTKTRITSRNNNVVLSLSVCFRHMHTSCRNNEKNRGKIFDFLLFYYDSDQLKFMIQNNISYIRWSYRIPLLSPSGIIVWE